MASWNYETEVAADTPLHWWKLSDPSGTAAKDDGSAAEDGTYTGTAGERLINQDPIIWGANPGPQGRAVKWNEDAGALDDGYMVRTEPTLPTTAIACEFWIENPSDVVTTWPLSYVITGPVLEFAVEFVSTSTIRTHIKGTATSQTLISPLNSIADGRAHHIYVDWRNSDGRLRLFLDGVQHDENTAIQTSATLTAGGTLMLAQNQSAPGTPGAAADAYEGRMDQVAIYSAPLSDARIRVHASAGLIRYAGIEDHADALTVDEFVVMGTAAPNFVLVAFDPLRGDVTAQTATTLTFTLTQVAGTLVPADVTVQIQGQTIYTAGTFYGEYTGSSVADLGAGVFQFSLVKATDWSTASRQEVTVYLPGETP